MFGGVRKFSYSYLIQKKLFRKFGNLYNTKFSCFLANESIAELIDYIFMFLRNVVRTNLISIFTPIFVTKRLIYMEHKMCKDINI